MALPFSDLRPRIGQLDGVVPQGRRRWNALNPVPLRDVFRRWVGRYETMWADTMLDIRDVASAGLHDGRGALSAPDDGLAASPDDLAFRVAS